MFRERWLPVVFSPICMVRYPVLNRLKSYRSRIVILFLCGTASLNLADQSRSASQLIIIWFRVHQLIEAGGGGGDFGVGMLPYFVQYLRKSLRDRSEVQT
jgi:hypothetical protein